MKRIAIGIIDQVDEKWWDSNMKFIMKGIWEDCNIKFVSFEAHTVLHHVGTLEQVATYRTFFHNFTKMPCIGETARFQISQFNNSGHILLDGICPVFIPTALQCWAHISPIVAISAIRYGDL